MRRSFWSAVPLFVAGLTVGQHGVMAADDELGAFLAATCVACHGPGDSESAIPPIVGWDEAKFVSVVQAYRSGERTDAIMQAMAKSLSDGETAALAHYFATQGRPQ